MKQFLLLLLPAVMLFTTSCYECKEKREVTKMTPIYMSDDDLANSVKLCENRAIQVPGKIYFKDNYIYIAEKNQGVHVIDNSDPYAPQSVGFISIPGSSEIAMKNQKILANSATDLITIDVSKPTQPVVSGRLKGAFPFEMPSDETRNKIYAYPDLTKGQVVGWREQIVEEETPCY